MTREDLLERIEQHETFAADADRFIKQQADDEEDDGGWVETGTLLDRPGDRHNRRYLREALRNEAEVRVERIALACRYARLEIHNGDGDKALFFENQATQERSIAEPMLADLRSREERKVDGAKGGANSWKPRKR
jgi:hypothetical protein